MASFQDKPGRLVQPLERQGAGLQAEVQGFVLSLPLGPTCAEDSSPSSGGTQAQRPAEHGRFSITQQSQATCPGWQGPAFIMSLTGTGAFHLVLSHLLGHCHPLRKQSHQQGRRRHTEHCQAWTWKWLTSL